MVKYKPTGGSSYESQGFRGPKVRCSVCGLPFYEEDETTLQDGDIKCTVGPNCFDIVDHDDYTKAASSDEASTSGLYALTFNINLASAAGASSGSFSAGLYSSSTIWREANHSMYIEFWGSGRLATVTEVTCSDRNASQTFPLVGATGGVYLFRSPSETMDAYTTS